MRNFKRSICVTLVAGTTLVAAPSLYAQGDQTPTAPKTDQPAMQGGMMGQGGMGGMGGMMNMMQQMSRMMDHCNKMMSERSHDGGGKTAPSPDKKG